MLLDKRFAFVSDCLQKLADLTTFVKEKIYNNCCNCFILQCCWVQTANTMSDSVILRSVKKFGEENHAFESDGTCKWPLNFLESYAKKNKDKVRLIHIGFKMKREVSYNMWSYCWAHVWHTASRINVMPHLEAPCWYAQPVTEGQHLPWEPPF